MRGLILLLGLVLTQSLWAAEFGTPRVLSSRGEPLTVVIPMTGIRPGTETAYFPLLAPQVAFDQRGISREAELTRLRYRVNATGPGQAELVLTTRESWEAASLTTLIEMYSPIGALLHPVTVSIPPRQSVERPGVQSVSREPVLPAATGATVTEITQDTPPKLDPSPASSASTEAEPAAVTTVRVNQGMTLWRIAERVRPEGLTMEQVMMALYASNPDAFEYGNVNALEKDRVLTVPNQETMAAIDAALASLEFKAHMAQPKRDFWADAVGPVTDQTTPVAPVVLTPAPVTRDPVTVSTAPEMATPSLSEPTPQTAPAATAEPTVTDAFPNNPLAEPRLDPGPVTSPSVDAAPGQDSTPATTASVLAPASALPEPDTAPAEEGVLVGRIADLESKLTAVDARISELIETITTPPAPTVTERAFTTAVTPDLQSADPTPTWVAWLRRPEILGALAGAAFLILLLIWRTTTPAVTAPRPVHAKRAEKPSQPVSPERVVAVQKDPLAQAIETVQHKLVEPNAQEKTESLYRLEDEEALLAAFSAEALNEHPDWGDDPDDEADLAQQQLAMVQAYLDKGMREVAIELLQRVSVSPDRSARTRAQDWLRQLHANA